MNKFDQIKAARDGVIASVIPIRYMRKLRSLEAKYGHLLYLPLDLPAPEIDFNAFKDWYFSNAAPVKKLRVDVAGATNPVPMFLSIDSDKIYGGIWEQKVMDDILKLFPGLSVYLDALPFSTGTRPKFSIWSSVKPVPPHRDQGPWYDMPFSFRYMLYDENPSPTLGLTEDPVRPTTLWPQGKRLPTVPGTNAFAWNNLRAMHGSAFDGHTKILMISHTNNSTPDLDQYEDLIERSLAKYGSFAMTSSASIADFLPGNSQ